MPHVETPQSRCSLGLARCDITPPVGIYHRMWGAATHDRSTGIHRPLTATALVFAPAQGAADAELVLIAVDHCLLWAREMKQLLESLSSATGLRPQQLLVAFSHTHAAGLMDANRVHLPGGDLIPLYLEGLAARLSGIVRQARQNRRLVTLTYGQGRCDLAAQRDFWDEQTKQFVCGFNPAAPADDTLLAARLTDDTGRLVATLVNYACHPTTLAWENTLISPDFPGAMREVVEQATGAPCVFLQGASGDLGPREGFVGDPAAADRNGRQLGHAALAVLEALPPPATRFRYTGPVVSGATLGTWKHEPLDADSLRRHEIWRHCHWTVDLPYRAGLPTVEQTRQELEHWQAKEEAERRAGNPTAARDARAMAERMTRRLTRLVDLPAGPAFPFPLTVWQSGDAFWVAVEAEFYQFFQRELRRRFPAAPVVVMTLVNGARPSYLPTADVYDQGIYQESVAVLAPGCLEKVLDEIAAQLADWQRAGPTPMRG